MRATYILPTRHPLFRCWKNMTLRCYDEKTHSYHRYGGRGIKISKRWLGKPNGFNNFANWAMNNGWRVGLEIDRENNDGHYCPNNCRFVDHAINSRNRSNVTKHEWNGQQLSLTEIARKTNLQRTTIRYRILHGISLDKAATVNDGRIDAERFKYKNKMVTVHHVAKETGADRNFIYHRLSEGMNLNQAVDAWHTRRKQRIFKFKGEMLSAAAIARICDVNKIAVYRRLDNGMSLQEAIKDARKHKRT